MMKFAGPLLVLMLIATVETANADIAPEPGYKRINMDLIVEATDDFPDYRFFLRTGAVVEELQIRKGEPLTLKSRGGGAFYGVGTVVAVPKASLAVLNATPPAGNKKSELQQAVYDDKVPGTIELIEHSFAQEVREAEVASWKDAVYRLEKRASSGIEAVWVSGGARGANSGGSGSVSFGIYNIGQSVNMVTLATVAAGILVSLAVLTLGLGFIWKRTRRIR